MFFRRILINALQPVLKEIGKVHAPWTHKEITGVQYESLDPLLKKGDVLLTRTRGELTTLLIPGYYKHAAIYIGDGKIIEAVNPVVREEDIITFLLSKDEVIVRRPTFTDDAGMAWAADWAVHNALGCPYDFQLAAYNRIPGPVSVPVKAFYCSKLIWAAYDEEACHQGLTAAVFEPRLTLGEPTITPDDIAQADKKWSTVWNSDKMGESQTKS